MRGHYSYNDHLENEARKESESGRLFRLIAKLGYINERHEFIFSSFSLLSLLRPFPPSFPFLPRFSTRNISNLDKLAIKRFTINPRWNETGDKYILKLFRDYVFHQVYEDGSPAIDFAHVVDTLNKVFLFFFLPSFFF